MAIGDVITVKINEIVASGDGLARFGNKAVFASRSCVGETVEVRVYAEQPKWMRAEFLKLVGKPSPDRVKPLCEFFGICGGCTMQHLRYETQLEAKVVRFIDKFRYEAGFRPPQPRVVASHPWEFQNYMYFWVKKETRRGADGTMALGFANVRGDEIVPISDCPIADPHIRSILQDSAKSGSISLPIYADKILMYSRGDLFLYDLGMRQGKVSILDKQIAVDVDAFIPSNIPVLERLIADLCEIADTADHSRPMLDMYCGIGIFSAFLADEFPGADLVDANKKAIARARFNVTAKNARFYAVKDRHWVSDVQPQAGAYGFMVVDLPSIRRLPQSTLEWLIQGGPPVLAYRSQDTASFARDAHTLCRAGYRLSEVTIYDFSPHNGFVDTLAVFDRG
jgi:23S rRNA (uracil1939-C5)-methyltransferase